MKAVCFQDVGKVVGKSIDAPKISHPRDAIVRTTLAGLCGSDLHPFWGREAGLDIGTVMGHEVVGEIVELGDAVDNFKVGDHVFTPFSTNCGQCYYCRNGLPSRCTEGQLFGWQQDGVGLGGCQSEFVRIPLADATLMKKPDGLSDISALLLGDNFSTGYYCAEMANVQPGGQYAIIGCGTVGLLCLSICKSLGADTVFAFDLVESRRRKAEELGAIALPPGDEGLKTVQQKTQGRGVDAVMELVGIPAAQEFAYQIIRPGGIMSVIGCHCTPNFSFSPVQAYDKNLTYKTGRCPARFYMDKLTEQVASGQFNIDDFVTHHFAPADCVNAYDIFSNRKDGCLKAVFDFQ